MPPLIEQLLPQLLSYGIRVVGVLVAVWMASEAARWLGTRTTKTLEGRGIEATLARFFGSLVRWLLIACAVLACLGVFGIETTSFAALIGAAGLAIGLAFQGTLGHFASGIMLLTFRPFKIGDFIIAAGQSGVVVELGLFATILDTPDRKVILPNGTIASSVIQNLTDKPLRRVNIDVGVAYDADLKRTREVLDLAASKIEGRDPDQGHQIIVLGLGDNAVNWQVRVWCQTADYWAVYEATITAVKDALDDANIGIPFPQMDVHLPDRTAGA